jgi:NADPH:quinone reductase-like Zn-dependent oxidoreductase
VLRLTDEPDPIPDNGKVRVRVAATTVNPGDIAAREGVMAPMTPNAKPPIVPGWDFAGELLDPAPGFEVGQRVAGPYPWVTLGGETGTYAEMVLADPAWLAPLPEGVEPVEAATVALNGLAAIQAVRMTGVKAGQHLVVTGASGAVGGFATQLAAAAGVDVVAVASQGDGDYVGSLGAKDVIERRPGQSIVAELGKRYPEGLDAILDSAGRAADLIDSVRDGGVFISVLDSSAPTAQRGIRVETMHGQPESETLANLLDRLASGQLRTRVADVMPLSEATEAHRRLAAGAIRGKLVLTP